MGSLPQVCRAVFSSQFSITKQFYNFQRVFLTQKLVYRQFLLGLPSSNLDKHLENSLKKMKNMFFYRFYICYLI
jgi:hypothetical protein